MTTRPHVVVVPYPGAGNINPALQLAKLLHHHGVYITFVNTEHNHRRVQAATGAGAVLSREGFRFEAIPDGLSESDRGAHDMTERLCMSMSTHCAAAPLRDLIERLNRETGVPPVTCLLPTAPMLFALGVARELGIPAMVLWCASAASLRATLSFPELQERGYVPLKDESMLTNGYLETTIIDWIPGMPPMRLRDVTAVLTTDPNDFWLHFEKTMANNCINADALILNTIDTLEADVVTALRAECRCVYSIGPLGSLLRRGATDDSIRLSLWKQDTECIAWLDTQEQRSVVYVNFGSSTELTPEQVAEFAWGLAASGHPFLLCIRDNLLAPGGVRALPPAESTAGRCHVTTWCPQEQVLGHRAVGCFLTHNGWNSTCESVAAGVPMVCWPGCTDQFTNCKYTCDVWGVGVRLDAEVRRDQVAERVREAMASEAMRASAGRWREAAAAAVGHGGSSYEHLLAMVTALHHGSTNAEA